MRTCSGIRADGGRCNAQPMRDSEWCLNHDPDRAEANHRRSSKGGKRGGRGRAAKPTVELHRLQQAFEDLADEVKSGHVDSKVGAVIGQLLNYARACVRDGIQAREQEELVARMEALEEAIE